MDCDSIVRDGLAERYLLGGLSAAEQEAYELHFFECERCFGQLRTIQAIQDTLRAAPPVVPAPKWKLAWNPWWGWLAAGAVAASLVAALLLRPVAAPELVVGNQLSPVPATAMPPATPGQADADAGHSPEATVRPGVTAPPPSPPAESAQRSGTTSRRMEVLARLARVEPPGYSRSVLRGATDEATLRFDAGMGAYTTGEYAVAVQRLREAAALDSSRPDIVFFLGASELLSGNSAGAVKAFQRTIAMGDTAFLEEGHFYLAKAYLTLGDVDRARAELTTVTGLVGERTSEAHAMRTQLAALPSE